MKSPYSGLGPRSFWRTGVVEAHALEPKQIYVKKFEISSNTKIATAGSCFAQHLAGRLRVNGFHVLDVEPAPTHLEVETSRRFGFNLYSARYGNIYTVRQLLQLLQECDGLRFPVDAIWEKDGRYFDALRPAIEPNGFARPEFVLAHRRQHLTRVARLLEQTDIFVFTLGLTEAWMHLRDGTIYPTAPGSVAGSHDPAVYGFKNFNYTEILDDFLALREMLKARNPEIHFLLTVSPVPLTATASKEHVLSATTYSKSVLRAVAGFLSSSFDDIDYFPSYEIVASAPSRGIFYENNLRSVSSAGVDVVMKAFFQQHGSVTPRVDDDATPAKPVGSVTDEEKRFVAAQGVFCEEVLLEAFAP
jgi:hypothetical protein